MSFWGNNVSGQGQDRYVKASQEDSFVILLEDQLRQLFKNVW